MLQWMGGSRRKVTTLQSRKSTQKRQKQYFEQRKRQQQQEKVEGIEYQVDGLDTYDNQRGSRSLDILSLLNVSKVAEEFNPLSPNEDTSMMTDKARARSFEDLNSKNHHCYMGLPTVVTNEVAALDCDEPIGTGSPLSYQPRTKGSKRSPVHGTSRKSPKVRNSESEQWRNDSLIIPSILDIIGDDGGSNTSERMPGHEAHVAFSIEGLGDLGTETPVQSPQQPTARTHCVGQSLSKATKKLHFSKYLNTVLDDVEMEMDMEEPNFSNGLNSFPSTEDVLLPFSSPDHDLSSSVKAGRKHGHRLHEMNPIEDDCFWSGGASFLNDDLIDDQCGVNRKSGIAIHDSNSWTVLPGSNVQDHQSPQRSRHNVTGKFNNIDLVDIGTETHVQSPQQLTASMRCEGPPSRSKAIEKRHFSKYLNTMLDDVEMQMEIKEPTFSNDLGSFSSREDVLHPFSCPDHALSSSIEAGRKHDHKLHDMNPLEDEDDCFWSGGTSFLNDDLIGDQCAANRKGGAALHNSDSRTRLPGSNVKDPRSPQRSRQNVTGRFNDIGEGYHRFPFIDGQKSVKTECLFYVYTMAMLKYKPQANRLSPCTKVEDTQDNLTTLSEESCSSTAVKGAAADMPSGGHSRT